MHQRAARALLVVAVCISFYFFLPLLRGGKYSRLCLDAQDAILRNDIIRAYGGCG